MIIGHHSDDWPRSEACPVGDMADENLDLMAVGATTGRVRRPAQWSIWPMKIGNVMAVEAASGRVQGPAPWALWPIKMWM